MKKENRMGNKGFVVAAVLLPVAFVSFVFGFAFTWNLAKTQAGKNLIAKSENVNYGPDYSKSKVPAWQRQP